MIYRTGIIFAFIVSAGVIAFQIGSRLSDEAVMTIAGVLCGIVATIPISIFLLVVLTRERSAYEPEPEPETLTRTQTSNGETFARGFWTGYSAAKNEPPPQSDWTVINPNEPTQHTPRAIPERTARKMDA